MRKLKVITLIAKYESGLGWISTATLSNRRIGDTKSMTGEIGTHYYCSNIEESLNNTIECLRELNVEFWDKLDLIYQDNKQYNPNECPEEVLHIFKEERKRLVNMGILLK